MQYRRGVFGILDTEGIPEPRACLIDGGVDQRCCLPYYFCNDKRPGYEGYLFQYTLDGCGFLKKKGKVHRLTKGQGFFVKFPEKSEYYLPKEPGASWTFLYLHFSGEALRPLAERLEELTGGILLLGTSSKAVTMGLQFQERICSGIHPERYESSEFVYRFFCTLLREAEHLGGKGEYSISKRAVSLMENEYGNLEGIQSVSEQLGVSVEHFCRVFHKEMKVKPMQYLTNLRIQAAMCDLLNTEDTLAVIAHRNGFSNANYFGKVFKKQVGITPVTYRRMKESSQE